MYLARAVDRVTLDRWLQLTGNQNKIILRSNSESIPDRHNARHRGSFAQGHNRIASDSGVEIRQRCAFIVRITGLASAEWLRFKCRNEPNNLLREKRRQRVQRDENSTKTGREARFKTHFDETYFAFLSALRQVSYARFAN
ncbi:MAG: AbfB domain-containing protein [Pseudohongiellaceae bacterium]